MKKILFLGFGVIAKEIIRNLSKESDFSFTVVSDVASEDLVLGKIVRKGEIMDLFLGDVDFIIVSFKTLTESNRNLLLNVSTRVPLTCRVVNLSSSAVYGSSLTSIECDNKLQPINAYGLEKLKLETQLRQIFPNSLINLRIANLYGEVEFNDFVNNVIKCLRTGEPLNLYDSGSIVRDFVYLQDLVKTLVAIVNSKSEFNLIDKAINLNFGTGVGTSSIEIVRLIEKITQLKIQRYSYSRTPENMAKVSVLIPGSIHSYLDIEFSCVVSGLTEYCRKLGFPTFV